MLLIECPHCGPREESEFSCGGDAHISRPENGDDLTDAQWAQFLFYRRSTKGLHFERWVHAAGCRRWFNMARNTVTSEVIKVYPMGESAPEIDFEQPEH